MAKKVGWGVVGSCGIARRRTIPEGIVPASNAKLVGLYDRNSEGNAELARTFGAQALESLEDLLAAEIDAVYIATPVFLHGEQVARCLEAGKHVLCEKPLALSVAQAQTVVNLAKARGVQLGTAFMMRFHSQHQEALKIIQAGKLGKPVYARAQLSCWYPPIKGAWRQDPSQGGGGALADMGVHCIDLLEMFFGPAASVSCRHGNIVHAYQSEDGAVASLTFANGALGTVDSFFCIPDEGSRNVLELFGSDGGILAKGTIGQDSGGEMTFYARAKGGYDAQQEREGCQGLAIRPTPVNTYRAEIEEFSRAILDGRPSTLADDAGLRSQKVLQACYESARTSRNVAIA